MERKQLPPIAVTADLPVTGKYEPGQEVILIFHGVAEWVESNLGWALQAMGWRMEKKDGNIICRLPVTHETVTCSPAHIEGGKMRYSSREPLTTSDGY